MTAQERGERIDRINEIVREMDALREERDKLCQGIPWRFLPRSCEVVAVKMVYDQTGCSAHEALSRVRAWNAVRGTDPVVTLSQVKSDPLSGEG